MPERLMATIWSQPSTETFLKLRRGRLMPALFTRMSTRPRRLCICCIAFETFFWSDTSSATASPLLALLISFSAFFRVSALRPEITTWAPARESSIPAASPIPEPPPVIQATLPLSGLSLGILRRAKQHFGLFFCESRSLAATLRQYFERALHCRPRRDALAPALESRELLDIDALALRRAHPGHGRPVGYAVLVAAKPLAFLQPLVDHAVEALRLVAIAVHGVLDLLRRVLQEMVRLAEHRADVAHLRHDPLHHHPALAQPLRQEPAGLRGEVEQHRARLGERERFPARPVLVDHRRDLVVRRGGEEIELELVARADVDGMDCVFEACFLEHDVDLVPVGRRPGIEVNHRRKPPRFQRSCRAIPACAGRSRSRRSRGTTGGPTQCTRNSALPACRRWAGRPSAHRRSWPTPRSCRASPRHSARRESPPALLLRQASRRPRHCARKGRARAALRPRTGRAHRWRRRPAAARSRHTHASRTSCFPKFCPLRRAISPLGAFSMPSTTDSRYFSLPCAK